MTKFWRGHPATLHQQEGLPFPEYGKERKRVTQADVLLTMLREARAKRAPLELPSILARGIAQYNARLAEIRERGFVVRNELTRTNEGIVHSRYWLEFDPEDGR